jgi:hypothetical protein
MYRANRDFTFNGIEYRAGVTYVSDDEAARVAHPDYFEQATASSGRLRSEIRATYGDRTEPLYTGADVERALEHAAILDAARDPSRTERAGQSAPKARRPRDDSPGHEAREAGLRALDEMEVSADARDRLDDLVRRDRSGIDSRYLAAVSDPAYTSAFWKRLAQPDTAQHGYTADEARATRAVAEVMAERAMAEGTGSTGGFGVPYALDPTIVLTSDGSIDPLRELATVSTTTTKTWKGVNSAGISAAFSDEAVEASDDSPTADSRAAEHRRREGAGVHPVLDRTRRRLLEPPAGARDVVRRRPRQPRGGSVYVRDRVGQRAGGDSGRRYRVAGHHRRHRGLRDRRSLLAPAGRRTSLPAERLVRHEQHDEERHPPIRGRRFDFGADDLLRRPDAPARETVARTLDA